MIASTFVLQPRTPRERREFWIFLLIALIIIAAGIGLRDPWPADEPRFTLVAKQMVDSGEWLITHRGNELYSDKPPMFMAMQAAAYELTGHWRIAFLLPSLLASLGTLFLIYDLGRRLWDHRTGLWAMAAALAAFQFVYQAKRAQIDPLVTFFITLANYGLLRHFLLGPDWRAYWLGCFAAGLGVITKGVGVLALLMFLPFLFARWRGWNHVAQIHGSALRWLGGALAFVVAIALWIVPMLIAVHTSDAPEYRAYMNDILFRQTAGRYTDSWDHHQPVWYYIGVIAFSWLPLSFAMIGAVPRWIERLKARDARFLLPLAWVVLIVLFFSFPKGKRDVYIMPALPWMALMTAPLLSEMAQRPWFRRLMFGFVVLLALLFLGGGIAAWSGHAPSANEMVAQRGLENGGAALWGLLIAIGAVAALAALVFRVRRSLVGLGVTLASMWLLWGFWAYPVLNDSTSAAQVMRRAGEIAGPEAELGLVAWKEQNLLLADRKVTDFGFLKPWHSQLAEAIRWQEADVGRRWVFVLEEVIAPCIDPAKAVVAGYSNRRKWLLFRADAVMPECRGGNVPVTKAETPNAANAE
jgi:4-amino-4-deoxy-L-arabinose transferase-like glycosyltransferase